MRALAATSLEEHQRLRATHRLEAMPQPVDGLYFLRTVLRHLGRDTSAVNRVLRDLEREQSSAPRVALQYMNA